MTPSDLPTGIVTFLFTDIEGSTGLLQALGAETYGHLQDAHSAIMREAIDRGSGVEIRTEGDAFFAVFGSAAGALLAATEAQRGLAAHVWPDGSEIRVRIGIHRGHPNLTETGYIGLSVHAVSRVCQAAHGGQIVVSRSAKDGLTDGPPNGVTLRSLGQHRLRGFPRPDTLYQVVADGLAVRFPKLRTTL